MVDCRQDVDAISFLDFIELSVDLQEPKFIGKIIRVAGKQNAWIQLYRSWSQSIDVVHDIGRTIVRERIVVFRVTGKLIGSTKHVH